MATCTVFNGTGCYVPDQSIAEEQFIRHSVFYGENGSVLEEDNREIVRKFYEVTGIRNRRYARDDLVTSDIAHWAAREALTSSGTDPESLDVIIVAHNFGDVPSLGTTLDLVPSFASRLKHDLRIENPRAIAYDLIGSGEALDQIVPALASGPRDAVGMGKSGTYSREDYRALEETLASPGTKEALEQIVVCHDARHVACLAEKVKRKLGIGNPRTIAYDLPFGCPGWIQGVIQADHLIRAGRAKRVLVVGAEILSRVSDPHDRDSMIYADGAGAVILEARDCDQPAGILAYAARSDASDHAYLLSMGRSYRPDFENPGLFLKMKGHEVFEYALRYVPKVVKESLDQAGLTLNDVTKVLIHQANEKLDERILYRLCKLFNKEVHLDLMPMIISWLGNNSVATIPTLLDLILKGKINHRLKSHDLIVLASVGAGMNINSLVYRFP
jgi:3-oxoacyl-[acyl-carrier-protein] synthase III